MESTTGQGEAMPQAPAAPPNATRSTPAAAQTQPSGFSGPLPKDATAQPQMQDRASVQASAGAQQYPPPPTTPPVIPGSAPLFAPWPTMTQTAPNPQGHPPMSFAPGAYGHMPPLPPVQPIELSPEKPRPMLADFLLAVAMVVVGFFFWEWHLITMPFAECC